jgi:hypothetical protein
MPARPVVEIDLNSQGRGFLALVGRDILSVCLFVYDGGGKQFILSF